MKRTSDKLRLLASGRPGTALALVLCAAGAVGLGACRDERTNEPPRQFLPDMDDQPKYKAQSETPFFEDRRAMRPAIPGRVAFGHSTMLTDTSRFWELPDDPALFEGVDESIARNAETGEPGYMERMPQSVLARVMEEQRASGDELDRAGAVNWLLTRGQERFNIYCSACHGFNGEGGGMMPDGSGYGGLAGRRWSYAVPNLHDPKYSDRTVKTGRDGYLFNVIRHGVPDALGKPPKMPAYGDKMSRLDSWAIVSYVRVLQASWVGSPPASTPTPATAPTDAPGRERPDSGAEAGAGPVGAPRGQPGSEEIPDVVPGQPDPRNRQPEEEPR